MSQFLEIGGPVKGVVGPFKGVEVPVGLTEGRFRVDMIIVTVWLFQYIGGVPSVGVLIRRALPFWWKLPRGPP